jgi:Na+/citrate or Na+/malate symporter
MSLLGLLIVIVILGLLFGGWGYRSGYYGRPVFGGSIVAVIVVVLLVYLLLGHRL